MGRRQAHGLLTLVAITFKLVHSWPWTHTCVLSRINKSYKFPGEFVIIQILTEQVRVGLETTFLTGSEVMPLVPVREHTLSSKAPENFQSNTFFHLH